MKIINREKLKTESLKIKTIYQLDTLERTPRISKRIALQDYKIHLLLGSNIYYLDDINYFNLTNSLMEEIPSDLFDISKHIEVVEFNELKK